MWSARSAKAPPSRSIFPRWKRRCPGRKRSRGWPTLPQGAETILLVEDEGGVRTLGREVLQPLWLHGSGSPAWEGGLDLMASYAGPLQLLVTDVVMPQMHGRTLATLLTAQRPGLKVLFVTGYADPPLLDLGLSDGEVSLLMKPFTPSSLARKVREVLDQRPGSSSTN